MEQKDGKNQTGWFLSEKCEGNFLRDHYGCYTTLVKEKELATQWLVHQSHESIKLRSKQSHRYLGFHNYYHKDQRRALRMATYAHTHIDVRKAMMDWNFFHAGTDCKKCVHKKKLSCTAPKRSIKCVDSICEKNTPRVENLDAIKNQKGIFFMKTFQDNQHYGFALNNYFLAGTRVLQKDTIENKDHKLFTKLSVHQTCNKLTNHLWQFEEACDGAFVISLYEDMEQKDGQNQTGWYLSEKCNEGFHRDRHGCYTTLVENKEQASQWLIEKRDKW